jgi:hypothetical protein
MNSNLLKGSKKSEEMMKRRRRRRGDGKRRRIRIIKEKQEIEAAEDKR